MSLLLGAVIVRSGSNGAVRVLAGRDVARGALNASSYMSQKGCAYHAPAREDAHRTTCHRKLIIVWQRSYCKLR